MAKVLIGFEFSQIVTKAFHDRGHDVISVDLDPGEKGLPHRQENIFGRTYKEEFDLAILFPPCTDLSVSGARWFKDKRLDGRQQESIGTFMMSTNFQADRWAIENPVGIMSTLYRKPDQIIQPWQFGHGEQKQTCLWLHNLPLLQPTNIVDGREQRVWKMAPSEDRGKERSRFYPGIAEAMAKQWGGLL